MSMKSAGVLAMVIVLGSGLALPASAKKIKRSEVPEAVMSAFAGRYPKASVRNFLREKQDGKTVFEIESLDGVVKRDVSFAADGTVLEVEQSIAADALPEPVKQSLQAKHPKAKIKAAEKAIRGADVAYELVLKQGRRTLEVVLDPSGQERPKK